MKASRTEAPTGKLQGDFKATPTRAELLEFLKNYHAQGADLHWLRPTVLGVKNSGKAPIDRQWNCKPRPHTLKALWDIYRPGYNIGMCCAMHNRIVVLDVDFGGRRQAKAINVQLMRLGVRSRDCQVRTGSGGLHYYYTWPKGLPLPTTQVLWAGGPHCEIRLMGIGSNVVLPPSLHWSGNRYCLRFSTSIRTAPRALVIADAAVPATMQSDNAMTRPLSPNVARARAFMLESMKPRYHETLLDAASLLNRIDNTGDGVGWDDYKTVMLALQNTFGDDSRALFFAWAQQSKRFDAATSARDWSAWGRSKPKKKVTYGSLVHLATKAGAK